MQGVAVRCVLLNNIHVTILWHAYLYVCHESYVFTLFVSVLFVC